jgi:hypothetical protein
MPAPICSVRELFVSLMLDQTGEATYREKLWCSFKDKHLKTFARAGNGTGESSKTSAYYDDLHGELLGERSKILAAQI